MTKQTHVIDGVAWCGTLEVAPPFVGMRDATLGSCGIQPEPPGRQRTATLKYPNAGGGTKVVDCTQWLGVFGCYNATSPPQPFPGAMGSSPAFVQFTGNGYVALEFIPDKKVQMWPSISSYNGVAMDGAWSTSPGDFTHFVTKNPGEAFSKISTDPTKPGMGGYFPIGQKAYFNMRPHNVTAYPFTVQFNLFYTVYP